MSRPAGPMAKGAIISGQRNATVLAGYTTLGLGGPARDFMSADSEQDLIDAVRSADRAAEPVLLLGGGSNLVISDEGFPGTVVHVNTRGLTYVDAGDGAIEVDRKSVVYSASRVAPRGAAALAGSECRESFPRKTWLTGGGR